MNCRICGLERDAHDDAQRAALGDERGVDPLKSDHYFEVEDNDDA